MGAAIFSLLFFSSLHYPLFSHAPTPVSPAPAEVTTMFVSEDDEEYPLVRIGDSVVFTEVVATPFLREKGLSGRDTLDWGKGMLFVFDRESRYSFWMKDMRFSIDMIWISSDFHIADIESHVSPDTYPKTFAPSRPAQYVLEVPAGYARAHQWRVGDVVDITF